MSSIDWSKARCDGLAQEGVDFDPPDTPTRRSEVALLKVICEACPIRQECLEYAVDRECSGVWGGVDLGQVAVPHSLVSGVFWRQTGEDSGRWFVRLRQSGKEYPGGIFMADEKEAAELAATELAEQLGRKAA